MPFPAFREARRRGNEAFPGLCGREEEGTRQREPFAPFKAEGTGREVGGMGLEGCSELREGEGTRPEEQQGWLEERGTWPEEQGMRREAELVSSAGARGFFDN